MSIHSEKEARDRRAVAIGHMVVAIQMLLGIGLALWCGLFGVVVGAILLVQMVATYASVRRFARDAALLDEVDGIGEAREAVLPEHDPPVEP